jgi:septal ring factor EnvC (AmiA/AmiB activator)
MNTMKTTIIFAVAFLLALSLCACGTPLVSNSSASEPQSADFSVDLNELQKQVQQAREEYDAWTGTGTQSAGSSTEIEFKLDALQRQLQEVKEEYAAWIETEPQSERSSTETESALNALENQLQEAIAEYNAWTGANS